MRIAPSPLAAVIHVAFAALALAQPAPELRFTAPPDLASGTSILTSVRLVASTDQILSWSLGVTLEGLEARELTTAGTDFERLSQGGYAESGKTLDGSAYYSVGVLSFVDQVTLPVGTSEILRVRCAVTRKSPGEVKILPKNGLQLPGDERVFSNEVLLVGGSALGVVTAERAFTITGCAGFLLAASSDSAEGPPGAEPIEVRHGSGIDLEVAVDVASASHLKPTGFSFGVKHDSALLSLSTAELVESVLAGYVKADGFAHVEVSPGGFAVQVLSSASAPEELGPGRHAVARAHYVFEGAGRPGDRLAAAFALSDELTVAGQVAPARFEPRQALPCESTRLEQPLVLGPDWWVRGDANSDGRADLSDAIVILGFLFTGGAASCERAMEVNRDDKVDISDPIALLSHLFVGGPAPLAPFPGCGAAEETRPCARFPCPAGG